MAGPEAGDIVVSFADVDVSPDFNWRDWFVPKTCDVAVRTTWGDVVRIRRYEAGHYTEVAISDHPNDSRLLLLTDDEVRAVAQALLAAVEEAS